jgi:diguanylate cyclase (GGDEF)-like protein
MPPTAVLVLAILQTLWLPYFVWTYKRRNRQSIYRLVTDIALMTNIFRLDYGERTSSPRLITPRDVNQPHIHLHVARRLSACLRLLLVAVSLHVPACLPASAKSFGTHLEGIITSIGMAHDLPANRANGASVHLIGTVTFYDFSEQELFIQDGTGGIYVNTDRRYPIRVGDLLEVTGSTDSSYRTEVASGSALRVLGRGKTYPVPRYDFSDLIVGRGDCRLVRIRGRVRAANIEQHVNTPTAHMDVVMPTGRVDVFLAVPEGFHPEAMLDAEVEITGVSGGLFDAKNQLTGAALYAQDTKFIRILQKPRITADRLPMTEIDDVFQSRFVTDDSSRVRVHGTVTYYKKGDSAVLESNGKSIFVQTRQTGDLEVGDVVDAFGFGSSNEYAPSLRDAYIVTTGGFERIAPRPVTYAEALSGLHSDNLISLTGILISQLHRDASDVLVVEVDGHLVTGYVQSVSHPIVHPLGSLISIAGICRISPGGPWRAPYAFHLDMQSEADVHILAAPSWWTVAHLVELLSLVALLALGTAIWALALRRRNVRQTVRIQRSMTVAQERSRILEHISSNTSPNIVLSEICNSVRQLLPDFDCVYFLEGAEKPLSTMPSASNGNAIKMMLTGPDGREIGEIAVTPPNEHELATDQLEILTSLTELSTLAVRQSLLYEGLLHHSTHDPLTDLPNRRLCENRLNAALEQASQLGSRLAVIYVDVNRFKQVNDKYGHKTGDLYLRLIGQRLLTQIRPTDTLARIGGDEFLIIVPLSANAESHELLAARLRACFDQPFPIDDGQIEGSASFGVAIYPDDGTTAEDLKRNADYAMYLAKRSAGDLTRPEGDLAVITPGELKTALHRDQFSVVYQPQFSADGRLTGLETLLRLQDPILGTLTPDAFISVAERSGIICDIGEWVLRRALRDAVHWRLHEGKHILVAVNISMRQIEHPGFAKLVLDCLQEAAFPADRLELELVERSMVSTCQEVSRELEQLRSAGVRLSLDDFGIGESCLSMLHTLPVDTIKIDRSFISAMDHEPRVLPIIQAIIFIARSLGKRIVAEGLEYVRCVPDLIKMGPIEFQGYLLGRPVPSQEIDLLIAGWRAGITMPREFEGEATNFLRRT